jgi:hypothetical protein
MSGGKALQWEISTRVEEEEVLRRRRKIKYSLPKNK